jgi:hypothetical protein
VRERWVVAWWRRLDVRRLHYGIARRRLDVRERRVESAFDRRRGQQRQR